MKNNKGMTLVELLAVIVIMGILSTMAVVGVSSILNKSRVEFYKKLKKNVSLAAKSYYGDHRILLPREINATSEVSIADLIQYKYIDKVQSHKKEDCTGKVTVEKVSSDNYKYTATLSCPNIDNKYLNN